MRKAVALILVAGLALAQAGQKTYQALCQSCHQPTGAGIPGSFPPLVGHVPEILAKKDGRTYLISVVLYGFQGEITVKGQKYNGVMPNFGAQLKDKDVADLLTYIATSWGNKLPAGQKPFTEAEVKAVRAKTLTPQQVWKLRKKLGL